jgi:hypothetical protein
LVGGATSTPERRLWFVVAETRSEFDDESASLALVFAMAARNAVEDLHVAGAFSDRQAPTLNRLIRSTLFELLLARNEVWRDSASPYRRYLAGRVNEAGESGDDLESVVRAAIVLAIRDYAVAVGLDSSTERALAEAASTGAVDYAVQPLVTYRRSKSRQQLAYLARMIPSYWEPPELSDAFKEFQTEIVESGR